MAKSLENIALQVGKSFANVLFEDGSVDVKKITAIEAELLALSKNLDGEPLSFFQNPVFDQKEKDVVLEELSKQLKLSSETKHFFQMVVKQGLSKYLPQISGSFSENIRVKQNEVRAQVTSAFKLTAEQEREIARALEGKTGKKVTCEVRVDPELIGGVVANIGGILFDASIRGYLDRIQEELAQ